jgi:hypothetical protein
MKIEYPIYEDGIIAVALFAKSENAAERSLFKIQIKYLQPQSHRNKEGELVAVTNIMGGETDWFIIPYSFSVAVAKTLIEQKTSGLPGFSEEGFERMIKWLIELEEIQDAMCY